MSGLYRLGRALRSGEVSACQLVDEVARRAAALADLGATTCLTIDAARERAAALDDELKQGIDRGPLHGIPMTVKDVIDVAGAPTALGTAGAAHRRPTRDAEPVARLLGAGVVVVGKAATHELAFGTVTPGVRNPRRADRIAGGSSGGSAAGVAAGLVPASLATDTGGSIRCPASLCGVVGMNPTHTGSQRGVAPLAPSQDTVGAIAADVATALAVMTTLGRIPSHRAAPIGRVGVDPAMFARVQPGVAGACRRALARLGRRDVASVEIALPHSRLAPAASLLVMLAEAARTWPVLALEPPDRLGPGAAGALLAGAQLDDVALATAVRWRRRISDEVVGRLERHRLDALALPSLPVTAAPLGSDDVAVEVAHARFASIASLTGLPAVSVPCGVDDEGLPVGLELLGRRRSEGLLAALAAEVEQDESALARPAGLADAFGI